MYIYIYIERERERERQREIDRLIDAFSDYIYIYSKYTLQTL